MLFNQSNCVASANIDEWIMIIDDSYDRRIRFESVRKSERERLRESKKKNTVGT